MELLRGSHAITFLNDHLYKFQTCDHPLLSLWTRSVCHQDPSERNTIKNYPQLTPAAPQAALITTTSYGDNSSSAQPMVGLS